MKTVQHFTSKRGTAVVTVYEDQDQSPYVTVTIPRLCWVDWPIRYYDGTISYDAPYRVPKYARSMVAKAYEWIDQNYPTMYSLYPTTNLVDKSRYFITCNRADMQPYQSDSAIADDFWGALNIIARHALKHRFTSIVIRNCP